MVAEPDDIKYLYKYRDLNESSIGYVEKIFTNSEIYFSKPIDFNDPFDCAPKFSLDATKEELKKYLNDRLPEHFPALNREQRRAEIKKTIKSGKLKGRDILDTLESSHKRRLLVETGVCCFSQIPNHPLMWSHYANGHTGICIEFEATSYTKFFGLAQKVRYKKEYPVVNPITQLPEDVLESALLTKAEYWSYEKEWRIALANRPPGSYRFPPELLKGVILGTKISHDNKEKVLSWIKSMKIETTVYQAFLKKYEYGIDIKPLN